MKYNKKAICQTANTLRKRGYTLSQAFVLAWAIAKGSTVKVAGTSKLNRQEALRRLTKYSPSETRFTLIREPDNSYDENAIAVMVSVRDSKQYKIGYIEAHTAKIVSAVLDRGLDVKTRLNAIVGGFMDGINYGLRLNIAIVDGVADMKKAYIELQFKCKHVEYDTHDYMIIILPISKYVKREFNL